MKKTIKYIFYPLFFLLLFGSFLTSCGSKQQDKFLISNKNAPSNLIAGYSTMDWDIEYTIYEEPISLAWWIINVGSNRIGNKLTINQETGKLTLVSGLTDGTYEYEVHCLATFADETTFSAVSPKSKLTIVNQTFQSFTINTENKALSYDYVQQQWTPTYNLSPYYTDAIVAWSVRPVGTPTLSSRIRVIDNKITLLTGVYPGTYKYVISGTVSKLGFDDISNSSSECTIVVGNGEFNDVHINNSNAPSSLSIGYTERIWNALCESNTTPDSITWTLNIIDNALNGKLSINSTTGALTLNAGLELGTYQYTISATLIKNNYNNKTITSSTQIISVGNNTFTSFTINSDNIPQNINAGYSQLQWTQTYQCSPTPDSIIWSITYIGTWDTTKLTIDANTGLITLATGLNAGNYKYKVEGVAQKTDYANAQASSNECTITITPEIFSNFSITNENPSLQINPDYIEQTWNINYQCSPTPDSITWSITDCSDPNLLNYLQIDANGGVKLLVGLPIGIYTYKIHGVAQKVNYTPIEVDSDNSTIEITGSMFTSFTINADNIPTNLDTSFTIPQTWTQTYQCSPLPDSIEWEISIDSMEGDILSAYISVDQNGLITLSPGIPAGEYTYFLEGTAYKNGYNSYSTSSPECTLVITQA